MMRHLPWLLLACMLIAGCLGTAEQAQDQPGGFAVRVSFDERGTYYNGDDVVFTAQATREGVAFSWDLGDGTSATGASVTHAYSRAGLYTVQVVGTLDGFTATDSIQIPIQDMFGNVPAPTPVEPGAGPAPPPPTTLPGAYAVGLPEGEPTVGEPAILELTGPAGAGSWTVWAGDDPVRVDFDATPVRLSLNTTEAGAQDWLWLVEADGDEYGSLRFDVWGEPIEWSAPTSQQWLRPGAQTVHDGSQCTVNFLFHYKWYRFFIGSAAHCIESIDLNSICGTKPTNVIGKTATVRSHGGASAATTIAYSSWVTMHNKGGGSCPDNDFALYELGPEAQKHMHPAVYHLGGPTALADDGYGTGAVLYGFGASGLRGNQGIAYPGQDAVNAKRGLSLGTSGYYQQVYYATPGIPGDSGGPALGPNGEALGAASVIYYAPVTGSNGYTLVPDALQYMREREGWAPQLVTYDDWTPLGV